MNVINKNYLLLINFSISCLWRVEADILAIDHGRLEAKFINERLKDVYPTNIFCDPEIPLGAKMTACIRIWNKIQSSRSIKGTMNPTAEFMLNNECHQRMVVFNSYEHLNPQLIDGFKCNLSNVKLKFEDPNEVLREEDDFYLASEGEKINSASVFVLIEMKYYKGPTYFNRDKYPNVNFEGMLLVVIGRIEGSELTSMENTNRRIKSMGEIYENSRSRVANNVTG